MGGGWSGARLCRLFIDGGSELYFLKFSENGARYERDFTNHIEAKKWLKDSAVDLKRVPAQGGSFRLATAGISPDRPPCCPSAFYLLRRTGIPVKRSTRFTGPNRRISWRRHSAA